MSVVALTGASGLIGKRVYDKLTAAGDNVVIFSRNAEKSRKLFPGAYKHVKWDAGEDGPWTEHIDGCDHVIHLAGEPLFNRAWTPEFKKEIYDSRIVSSRGLVNAMRKASRKPKSFISASAIGYYGAVKNKALTESDPAGNDFLARVCVDWEMESSKCEELGVRWACVRTGIVLDKNEGALQKMMLPFKLFIGGPVGNPKNYWSWIHLEDIASIYIEAMRNENYRGAINGAAPNPVTGKEFAGEVGKNLKRPSLFAVPEFALKLLFGERAVMISGGQKVVPAKLQELGYKFKYPTLPEALGDVLG